MKHGVRERARYSLIPSITSGYSGGSFELRREIAPAWRRLVQGEKGRWGRSTRGSYRRGRVTEGAGE
jgi:hypothetical protein